MSRYALVPDRVWDGSADQPQAGVAVVVKDGLIEAVKPAAGIPPDVEQRALPGCTLLPGLMDAHVHYSSMMGPAFLAAGVTTIRDVGNDLDWILDQRARHDADPTAGPGILCCGFLLDGTTAHWKIMGRAHADGEALRASVREEVKRGVNAVKFYANLNLEMLSAGVDEARKLKTFCTAHLGAITAEDAARAGLNEIQHLTGCGPAWKKSSTEEQDIFIDLMLKHGMIMTPTLVVWDRLGRVSDLVFEFDSRREWVHPCHLGIWNEYKSRFGPPEGRLPLQEPVAHMKRCLKRMQDRGLTIALGTDTPFPHLVPGFSVHDELAMYVDAGMKPVEALRSATSVCAKIFGIGSKAGRIAAGFQADMVAVKGNPLERINQIANVELTVRAGRMFRSAELLGRIRGQASEQADDPITRDLLRFLRG